MDVSSLLNSRNSDIEYCTGGPVCGFDGITYNLCEDEVESIQFEGPCDLRDTYSTHNIADYKIRLIPYTHSINKNELLQTHIVYYNKYSELVNINTSIEHLCITANSPLDHTSINSTILHNGTQLPPNVGIKMNININTQMLEKGDYICKIYVENYYQNSSFSGYSSDIFLIRVT